MNIALVLSGGLGERAGFSVPKQYKYLAGKPVIIHTIEQFQHCVEVSGVIVVATLEWKDQILEWKDIYGLTKLWSVAQAGESRQLSIRNGLIAVQQYLTNERDCVIIQDAVRPLTSKTLILRLLKGLEEAPCVLPVLPVSDTAYISEDGKCVNALLERSTLYAGQAPEAFWYHEYLQLYAGTPIEQLSKMSGSCQLPYSRGYKVKMIPGERENIKITYLSDLMLCENLLMEREKVL